MPLAAAIVKLFTIFGVVPIYRYFAPAARLNGKAFGRSSK
jgi:hypothetical protein